MAVPTSPLPVRYGPRTPHPLRTLTDKVPRKSFADLRTPRSYLNRTEDIAMPPGEFAWCPRLPARLGLCRPVQMPGGHEACSTAPACRQRRSSRPGGAEPALAAAAPCG